MSSLWTCACMAARLRRRQLIRILAAEFGQVFEKRGDCLGFKLSEIPISGSYSANDSLHGLPLAIGDLSNGRQARNGLSPPAKENTD